MQEESKSYLLPTETIRGLHLSNHIDDLIEVQDFIERRAITTKNTRIERYIQYLKQVVAEKTIDPASIFKNSAEGPFKSPVDWKLYVLREAHELMWILKGIKICAPKGLDDKLKTIVGGRDFAALDGNSHSRNAQFELRIASYFCQTGCDVDLSGETDIIAVSDRITFFLECKRVGSRKQLEKRLSDAKRQLRKRVPKKYAKHAVFSCIVADVTKVAFSHNGLTWATCNEHSKDVIQDKLFAIVKDLKKFPFFQKCDSLFNYWFQIHIPSLVLHPPTETTRFSSYHFFKNSRGRKERRALKNFMSIFEAASDGDPKTDPSANFNTA